MRRVEPFTPQHLDGLVALYARIFGAGKAERFRRRFDWQFVRNPFWDGQVTNWIMTSDSQVVGHFGAVPVDFKVGDERVHGSWLCDFMADVGHRSRPELLALRARVSESSDLPIAYGTPDRIARSFVELNWQWRTVGPFLAKFLSLGAVAVQPARRTPGPAGRAGDMVKRAASLPRLIRHYVQQRLRRLAPGRSAAGVEMRPGFDAEFDRLWESAGRAYPVAVVRDCKFLTWRYPIGGPDEARLVVLPGSDAPRGFAVLEKVRWRGIVVGLVSELVFPAAQEDDGLSLLAFAEDILRRERVAAMVTEGLPPGLRRVFLEHGFVEVNQDRENVIFYDRFSAFPPRLLGDIENWLLTPGDCDRALGYARVPWRNS